MAGQSRKRPNFVAIIWVLFFCLMVLCTILASYDGNSYTQFLEDKLKVTYTDSGDSVNNLEPVMQDPANVGFYLQNNTISGFKVTADFKVRGKVLFISPIPGETYERSYSGGNAVEVFGKFTLKIRRDESDSEYRDVYGYLKIERTEVR